MINRISHYKPIPLIKPPSRIELMKIDISRGWMPDYPPYYMPEGGLVVCENLWPLEEIYFPALSAAKYSAGSVSGTPLAGVEYFANDGNYYSFVGTTTKLYRLETNQTFTDVTRAAGGNYTTASDRRWYFDIYGEQVVATNYTDVPQILSSMTGANFAAIGGSPPRAKYCLQFYGHLILAYLNDGTVYPKKIIWSALDNPASWTASLTTGADSQNIAEAASPITGLARVGNYMAVFHRDSITMGWYALAPYTFNFAFHRISGIGAIEGSVISVGNLVYFFDERDIYAFDGNQAMPIGEGIKRTFLNSLDIGNLHRITAGHNARFGLIFWSYASTGSADGTPDKMLVYNYKAKKFSLIRTSQHCVFNIHRNVLDMDSMSEIFPDMDTSVPYDMDSNWWLDNSPLLACMTTDGFMSSFQGPVLTGIIETKEISMDNNVLYAHRVRPRVYNATDNVKVNMGYRFNEGDVVTYSSDALVQSNGYANVRTAARLNRIKLTTKLHEGIIGIDVEGRVVARR